MSWWLGAHWTDPCAFMHPSTTEHNRHSICDVVGCSRHCLFACSVDFLRFRSIFRINNELIIMGFPYLPIIIVIETVETDRRYLSWAKQCVPVHCMQSFDTAHVFRVCFVPDFTQTIHTAKRIYSATKWSHFIRWIHSKIAVMSEARACVRYFPDAFGGMSKTYLWHHRTAAHAVHDQWIDRGELVCDEARVCMCA